jgi:hypothetical protein
MCVESWRNALHRVINLAAILLLVPLLLSVVIPEPVSAEGKPILLNLDVWTDRGGKGAGTAGGTYRVGEKPAIYILASVSCQAKFTLRGPKASTSSQLSLPTNQTYSVAPGVLSEGDVGSWQITIEASAYNQTASDYTWINVIGTAQQTIIPTIPAAPAPAAPAATTPAATTPPSPALTTTPPGTSPTKIVRINAGTASVLLALNALHVFEGKQQMDLRLDVNEDNAVTAEDARLILRWAVNKQ